LISYHEHRAEAPAVIPWNKLPVLVVDDNETNRRILLEMLQHWGMKPALAESGKSALVALAGYVTKPVAQSELLDIVSAALGRTARRTLRKDSELSLPLPPAKRGLNILLAEDMRSKVIATFVRAPAWTLIFPSQFALTNSFMPSKVSLPAATGSLGISSSPTEEAPFDEWQFLARMDGSHEVCVQIAEAFLAECPKLMSALRTALKQKHAPERAVAAHALKGAIANFTGCTAFQSVVRLEHLAGEADLQLASEALKYARRAIIGSVLDQCDAIPKPLFFVSADCKRKGAVRTGTKCGVPSGQRR